MESVVKAKEKMCCSTFFLFLFIKFEHLLPPFLVVCRPLVLDVEESVEAALLFISRHFMHLQECEVY